MLRNAIKASSGAPELLNDLDDEILGRNARPRKPQVEKAAFVSSDRNTGRNFQMREENRRRNHGDRDVHLMQAEKENHIPKVPQANRLPKKVPECKKYQIFERAQETALRFFSYRGNGK